MLRNLHRAGAMALALSGLLLVGGCAEFDQITSDLGNVYGAVTGSVVSPNAVYVAANSFDAAETAATGYDELPLCSATTSVACRTTSGTASVDTAIRQGITLRNELEAYVTANPGALVPVSNYNALLAVVSTINSVVQAAGAK